ncbi:hypothetical protein SMICM304S_11181 [Streptomyces microflavus]
MRGGAPRSRFPVPLRPPGIYGPDTGVSLSGSGGVPVLSAGERHVRAVQRDLQAVLRHLDLLEFEPLGQTVDVALEVRPRTDQLLQPRDALPRPSSALTLIVWASTRVTVETTLREIWRPRISTVPVTFTLPSPPYATVTPSSAAAVRSAYETTAVPVARAAVALE